MNWDAKWIWVDAELPEINTYAFFRHQFRIERAFGNARALITCDSRYQLYVNGQYVGRGVAPNHPDQPFYDTYDLTSLLQPGQNMLAVVVHYRGIDTFNYAAGKPGLLLQLVCDEKTLVASNAEWKARSGDAWAFGPLPRISGQQGFIEIYDARKEPVGWTQPGFDDSGWLTAKEVQGPADILPRPTPNTVQNEMLPIRVAQRGGFNYDPSDIPNPATAIMADQMHPAIYELLAEAQGLCRQEPIPVELSPAGEAQGSYLIFDLGRESTGTIQFQVEAPAGVIIDIGHGEHLDDGRVRAFIGGRHFADRYITREGKQAFEFSFKRMGGRYVQFNIRHGKNKVILHRVSLLEDTYPFTQRGSFRCSDTLLNEIWDVSAHTLRCCVHETYEDCPWREQSQYSGDSRLQVLAGYRVFGETRMPRKALVQLATPSEIGFHYLTYPGKFARFIPGYDLIWVPMVWEYYLQTGEVELVKELFPEVRRLLGAFAEHTRADGLIEDLNKRVSDAWQFTDWAGLSEEGIVAAQNQFYLEAIQCAAEMAGVIGQVEESARFRALAKRLSHSLVKAFRLPGDAFLLGDNLLEMGLDPRKSQHVHSLALLLDMVPQEDQKQVVEAMLSDPSMAQATLYFKYYLFAAMLKVDRKNLNIVLGIIRKHWGEMLRQGATSFWEREDGGDAFGYAGSLCHAWSSHPAFFFSSEVLGIKNEAPGGTELLIYPNPGDLSWAKGVAPFAVGDVHVAWEKGPHEFVLEVTVPEGSHARVLIPFAPESCKELALTSGEKWQSEQPIAAPFIAEKGGIGVTAGPGTIRLRAALKSE